MSTIEQRYGTTLRLYDNGGQSFDRYTIVPPRWSAGEYKQGLFWEAIASSRHPFHPQGFGQHVLATPGHHLGKRIHWRELPQDVRRFAKQTYPQFTKGLDS